MGTTFLQDQPAEPPPRADRPPDAASRASAPAARVLHLINGEHYSGAERVQDLLALGLAEHGFEVDFVGVKPGRFAATRRSKNVPLYEIAMRSRLDLRAARRVVRLVRRRNYQLLHAHTPRTALLARVASVATGVPFVYHVHSPALHDSTRRWRNRCRALVERISLGGASRLIAVSPSLRDHMVEQGHAAERVLYVPNGVPPVEADLERPVPSGTWTLGTVALFRPRKGVEVLLEALAELRSQGADVRLRAVGEFETTDYEAKIKSLVDRLGLTDAVEWTGFTEDVPAELATMDVFVLPSLFGEGLPMVVLEAMAAGVPVVATEVEGLPEAIRDEREGLLVRAGSASCLADAIGRIVRGEVDWQSSHRLQGQLRIRCQLAAGALLARRNSCSRKQCGFDRGYRHFTPPG